MLRRQKRLSVTTRIFKSVSSHLLGDVPALVHTDERARSCARTRDMSTDPPLHKTLQLHGVGRQCLHDHKGDRVDEGPVVKRSRLAGTNRCEHSVQPPGG